MVSGLVRIAVAVPSGDRRYLVLDHTRGLAKNLLHVGNFSQHWFGNLFDDATFSEIGRKLIDFD